MLFHLFCLSIYRSLSLPTYRYSYLAFALEMWPTEPRTQFKYPLSKWAAAGTGRLGLPTHGLFRRHLRGALAFHLDVAATALFLARLTPVMDKQTALWEA